ncbi:MAG TPA: fructose-bisphosphate aldolase [Chromatiales bacterium]|nr:fructose-bisphosphate aldolase [Chromatiales bacterium]
MALVQIRDMLAHARHNGYAVGAFRIRGLEYLDGVLQAGERLHAPLILTLSAAPDGSRGLAALMAAAEHAAAESPVPVALHLADCATPAEATRGINRGCNSIGVILRHDAPHSDTRLARQVAGMAHACGVPVTAAMATPAGVEDARRFAEDTGIDFLAIPDGSLGGVAEFLQGAGTPLNTPLCITGDQELDSALLSRLITHGVGRVDFDTVLTRAASAHLRRASTPGAASAGGPASGLRDTIAQAAEQCLEYCGCGGRAAEVLQHATPWAPVEHVIIYNVSGISEQDTEAMMAEGRRVLGAIPGVRRVVTGTAVKDKAAYKYCWIVTFVHPDVIDSYREHPAHVAFADNLFRPVAGERISIDYQTSRGQPPAQAKIMRRRNMR